MSSTKTESTVTSADGTSIGYQTIGTGRPLVLVHGSLTTGDEWFPVTSELAERYTCLLMDRRGRGRSADAPEYSIEKECQDIAAVLKQAGAGAFLLGHSYGAICALETARRTHVGKLVLYEPPLPIHGTVVGPSFAKFRAAVERSRLDEALSIGLLELVKMSQEEVAALRATPLWPEMVALTPTWTRECEVIDGLEHGVARFASLATPTLLIVGTATALHHVEASAALEEALPDARSVELEGQGHQAHLTATRDFAAAVDRFLQA